jgi:hypothetical protein
MRKLSVWAKRHPWSARVIIILSHILLLLLAWYTGSTLINLNVFLPGLLLFAFMVVYLSAVLFYPSKSEKHFLSKQLFYIKQKACDFSLAAASYGMVVCLANKGNGMNYIFQPAFGIEVLNTTGKKERPSAAEILESLKCRDKSTLTREEKRILKKEFRLQLKNYAVAKLTGNKDKATDAGLVILAIVAAVGLWFLLAALACNIACNGMEGAAVIVLILGTAGIIIGLIAVIRAITRGSKKKLEKKPHPNTSI